MVADRKRAWYYANGFQLSQCRQMCEFLFAGFYHIAKRDEEKREFVIYVFKTVKDDKGKIHKIEDYVDIEAFKEWWCKPHNNRKEGSQGAWKLQLIEKED